MTMSSDEILKHINLNRSKSNGVGLNTDGVGSRQTGVGLTEYGVGLSDLIAKRAKNGVGLSENTAKNTENGVGLTEKTQNFEENGVGYYNRDNKEKRDKKDNSLESISLGQASPQASPSSGQSSTSQLASCQKPDTDFDSTVSGSEGVMSAGGTPDIINKAFVHKALFTLFHNPDAQQKYKFKITINPAKDPSKQVQFIGAMTKDMRNFKKYIPEGVNIDEVTQFYKGVKKATGKAPYVGKVHLTMGPKAKSQRTQNEPYCWVGVWYEDNGIEKGWKYVLKMYNWTHSGDLFDNNLTEKQTKANVKATDIWFNTDYHHDAVNNRNKTFMDLCNEKGEANV